nr:TonB-dependent receptor [Sphingomonas sp. CDS-1]
MEYGDPEGILMAVCSQHTKRILLTGLSLAALMKVIPAIGQTAGADPASQVRESAGIGDIVVTAQRRSEKLNDVGISVVAASGDALLAKGVSSTADLAKLVPGLTATETPYGTPVLTLRGVGFYESSLAGSSPVAAYVDEIPLPYTRMAAGTSLDIQRVEVLKGPQGTLYGQNSTGGAINFIANKPTDEIKAGFDASLGRFMDTDVQGFVSGPLGDSARARLALRTHQSGDWQKSVSREDTMGATRVTMGRFLLDVDASDALTFEFNLNGFIDRSDTQALAAASFSPNDPTSVRPAELAAVLTSPGSNRLADWGANREYRRNNWYYQAALKTTYSLGGADLIAITAYQHFKQDQTTDADGTNAEAADSNQSGYIKSFSQELRLQGEAGPIKYVVGANYSHDTIFDDTLYIVADGSQANGLRAQGLNFRYARTYTKQKADTYAGFANIDYELSRGVNLQGGIRYTKQDRSFTGCLGDPGPIGEGRWAALFSYLYGTTLGVGQCTTINPATGVIGLQGDDLNEDNISWRGAINYKPADGALIYASVSRGYKQGSFPTLGASLSTQYIPARQESLLAYEIGTKLSLLDRKLQLNASAFYYDYSDKQLRGKFIYPVLGTGEALINIPKSRVQGAELQILTAPAPGLTFEVNVTYADSKVQSDYPGLTPTGAPINLKGESFELTPKWAASGTIAYDTPVSDKVNAFAGVDVNYQSRQHGGYGGVRCSRSIPTR